MNNDIDKAEAQVRMMLDFPDAYPEHLYDAMRFAYRHAAEISERSGPYAVRNLQLIAQEIGRR